MGLKTNLIDLRFSFDGGTEFGLWRFFTAPYANSATENRRAFRAQGHNLVNFPPPHMLSAELQCKQPAAVEHNVKVEVHVDADRPEKPTK